MNRWLVWLGVAVLASTLQAQTDAHEGVRVHLSKAWISEGFAHVLGIVESTRDDFVSVRLVVERLDPEGRRISVRRWEGTSGYDGFYPEQDLVPPKGRAVFHQVRDLSKLSGAKIAQQIVRVDLVRARPRDARPTVNQVRGEPEANSPRWVVRGQFLSPPTADCRQPTLVVSAFNAAGELVGVSTHDPRDPYPFSISEIPSKRGPLSAGAAIQFTLAVAVDAPNEQIAQVEASGECRNRTQGS